MAERFLCLALRVYFVLSLYTWALVLRCTSKCISLRLSFALILIDSIVCCPCLPTHFSILGAECQQQKRGDSTPPLPHIGVLPAIPNLDKPMGDHELIVVPCAPCSMGPCLCVLLQALRTSCPSPLVEGLCRLA